MSFRGRGRGRGQVRTGSPEAESESSRSTPAAAPPEAGPSSSRAGSVAPGTNGHHHHQQPSGAPASSSSSTVANLLRKNDYTKKSNTPAMKFMPNMARRKQPGKIDLSVVKKEADERPPSQFKKPAGRGRGKPMMAEMTASGTFAMGPSQGLKKAAVSGGASFGGGGGGGGGGSGVSRSKDDGDDDGAAYDSSDEDDDWEPSRAASAQADTKPSNGRSADLSEIDKEDDMAPLVLPRDQGNVMGETEQNMLAKDEAQATLPPPPSIMPQVKDEPADEEELKSQLSTPAPESSTKASSLAPPEGEDQKKPTIVKSEHVADGFMQDQAAAAVEQLYVFQFPRVFPHFNPAPKPQQSANGTSVPMDVDGQKEEAKPDVKPTTRKPASGYVPGQWQGWGKAAGREGRDMTDLNFEGQVGKLRVHASGKVSLVLGSGKDKLRYDILPAAPASFLQEVAVQIPKTMERPDGEPPLQQGLYVMGQTDKKYVVRPNISQLLQGLDLKKEEAKMVPAKKEVEDPGANLPQKGTGSVGDLLARPKAATGTAVAAAGRGRAAPTRGTGATRPTGVRGRGRG